MAVAKPRKLLKRLVKKLFPASKKSSPGQVDYDALGAVRKRRKKLKGI